MGSVIKSGLISPFFTPKSTCSFGLITPLIIGGVADLIGAGTAADIIGTGLTGAAFGAGTSAVTGGNPLVGALTGGATGGLLGAGAGSALGGAVGLTGDAATTVGDTLIGAGVGAAGAGLSGANPLLGAATGGAAGLVSGVAGTSGTPTPTSADTMTPTGTPASAASAPGGASAVGGPSVAGLTPTDYTVGGTPAGAPGPSVAGGGLSTPIDYTAGGTPAGAPGPSVAGGGLASPITQSIQAATGGGGTVAGSSPLGAGGGTTGGGGGGGGANPISGGSGNIIDQLTKAVGQNPLGLLAATGGLGLAFANQGTTPSVSSSTTPLANTANTLATQGTQLGTYLASGTLPPGVQSAIDQATKAGIESIKSRYASMSATGSTAEAEDIAALQQNAAAQGATIATNLLQTGINESGLASGIYENLVGISNQQNQQTGTAIANLAAALSGAGRGVNINLPAGSSIG